MSEDAEIKAPFYAITAHDDDSVCPSFHKFIIQYDLPLRVHEFPVTKRHEHIIWSLFTSCLLASEVFERIG
jgi:hypothetical protein